MMSDENDSNNLLMRVRRAVTSTGQRVEKAPSKLLARVRKTFDETLAPAIEAKAREAMLKLAEPENARQLQRALAGLAQTAMRAGFRSDPPARLLFDFVDALEKRHTREQTLHVVIEHAVTYESDLLEMLLSAGPGGGAPGGLEHLRERASDRLLTLLCSLVALDREDAPPTDQQAQILYFEQAPIDERFKPLARMAAGDESAFASREAKADDDAEPGEQNSRLKGLVRRLTGQAKSDLAQSNSDEKKTDGTYSKTSALARFVPSLNDPVTRFLTMSYLFFLQSYLLRAMIEGLPEALEMAAELERDQRADDEDVVEIGD